MPLSKNGCYFAHKKSNGDGDGREACPRNLAEYGTHRKLDKMQIGTSHQADLPLKEGW